MSAERYAGVRNEELARLEAEFPGHRWTDAARLLDDLVLTDDFVEFLTLPAYPLLD
jgi:malate synthase